MKEHVDEMAKVLIDYTKKNHIMASHVILADYAEQLYNAGYRKQSEGEWIKTETNYTCSKCSFNVISWSGEYDGYECERGISLMNFCPNCGARMSGGKNE